MNENLGELEPTDDENTVYPVGCLLCGTKTDILIFPHRVDKTVVGLIYVCNPHASIAANGKLKIKFDQKTYDALEIKPYVVS